VLNSNPKVRTMNLSKIMVFTILSALLLSTIAIPVGIGQSGNAESKRVHVNMKAEDGFSPETEHDGDTEAQVKVVQANYQQNTPVSRTADWTTPVTWTSDNLKEIMTVQGQVTFNLWYRIIDEGYSGNPDWQFDLLYNEDSIAHVQLDGTAAEKNQPIEITANAPITEQIEAKAGDTFGISIRYRHVEDVELHYDNMDYDSGAAFEMDSVIIWKAEKSSATFSDAWGINWNRNGKFFCSLNYGGEVNMGDNDTFVDDGGNMEGDNGTSYSTNRIRFDNIEKGTGSAISVTISYGPNETSEGWTREAGANGDNDNEKNGDDFPIAMVGGVVVVGALVAVGAFLFIQKRKGGFEGEEYGDEEYEYEDEEYEEEEE